MKERTRKVVWEIEDVIDQAYRRFKPEIAEQMEDLYWGVSLKVLHGFYYLFPQLIKPISPREEKYTPLIRDLRDEDEE